MTSEGDSRVTDDLGAGARQGNGIGVLHRCFYTYPKNQRTRQGHD